MLIDVEDGRSTESEHTIDDMAGHAVRANVARQSWWICWEQPELFSAELRAGFRSLPQSN